jgi:hypothetical protein
MTIGTGGLDAEHEAPGGQLADRGELACRSSGREAGCAVICDLTR